MDAGTVVDDHCITEYNNLKQGKKYRYIIYNLGQNQQVQVDKLGGRDETYDEFVASLPKDQSRYGVFDFQFTTHDNPPRHVEKLVFIFWSPDTQAVKLKMTYATGKEALKKKLTGLQKEIQANDYSDLDQHAVQKQIQ